MSYKTQHNKLGDIEVLIEAEIDHANSHLADCNTIEGKKYFALVKSGYKFKKNRSFDYDIKWRSKNRTFGVVVQHYYVLWGNSPDLSEMGITHLLTPKLNTFRSTTTPTNLFFEMIRSSKFMTFKK